MGFFSKHTGTALTFRIFVSLITFILVSKVNSQVTTITFSYTGAIQNFTVPFCTSPLTITAAGASGSDAFGIAGGLASGVYSATPGQVLHIFVGGYNGYNGGGAGSFPNQNGGGASDVRVNGTGLTDRILVAGGGGGGPDSQSCTWAGGGTGGGGTAVGTNFVGGGGGDALPSTSWGTNCGGPGGTNGGGGGGGPTIIAGSGGGGGGLTSGGLGGVSIAGPAYNGSLGIGGAALPVSGFGCTPPLGGGGGGFYGGGGASGSTNPCGIATGGGGSSWTGTLSSPAFTAGANQGHGFVRIQYAQAGPLVQVTATPTVICAGGSAQIMASPMNSYTWSTGAHSSVISVTPGATTHFTVTATNSIGCVSSASTTVSVFVPSVAVTSQPSSVCSGQSATLIASGASSYQWNNGSSGNQIVVSPTSPSVYQVTASATPAGSTLQCVSSVSLQVGVFPGPTVSAQPAEICEGSTSTLSISGSQTQQWSTGVNSSSIIVNPGATAIYSVTATTTDGCISTESVGVAVYIPAITATPNTTAVCAGEQVTLTASGGMTYTWNGTSQGPVFVDAPNCTTVYTVNGTAAFPNTTLTCNAEKTISISVLPTPTISAGISNSVICIGETVTLTATGAAMYVWNTGQIGQTAQATPNTTGLFSYSVTGTGQNGCNGTDAVYLAVNECTGIETLTNINRLISVFPNPNDGSFTVRTEQDATVTLHDISGRLLETHIFQNSDHRRLIISDLPAGVYFIQARSAHQVSIEKISVVR